MKIDTEACERLLVLASLHGIDIKKDIDTVLRLSAAHALIKAYPEKLNFLNSISNEPKINIFHTSTDSLKELKEYIEKERIEKGLAKFSENPCINRLINEHNFKFFYKDRVEGNFIYFNFDYLTSDGIKMNIVGRRVQVAGGRSRFWYEINFILNGKKYKEKLEKIEMSTEKWKLPKGFPAEWKVINRSPWCIEFMEHVECYISAWLLINSFNNSH